METQEAIEVEQETVRCDGGGGPLGHPAIYMTFKADGVLICPYCSRKFVRKTGAGAAGH